MMILPKKPAILWCLLLATEAGHASDTLDLSTGIGTSSGRYGQSQTTEINSLWVGATYRTTQVTAGIRLPYVQLRAASSSSIGPDGQPITDQGALGDGKSTRQGMGDASAFLGYALFQNRRERLEARVWAKLATSDSTRGIGTGSNDYAIEARYLRQLSGFSSFAVIGYRVMGSSPKRALRNTPYAQIGVSRHLSRQWWIGSSLQWRSSALDRRSPSMQVTGFLERAFSPRWRVNGYLSRGITAAAPAWGGGVYLTRQF